MPDRPTSRARTLLLLLLAASACVPARAQDGARVTGTVVDFISRVPLAGRVVTVGDRRTITDARGAFTLDGVPAVYDLVIGEKDVRAASAYLGLTRRDPVLVHWPPAKKHDWSDHAATMQGTLAGSAPFPLPQEDSVDVRFLSPQVSQMLTIRQGQGPFYGPMEARWDGPATIDGRLIGLRRNEGPLAFWFADQPVRLGSGQKASAALALAPVPVAHTVLEVALPADHILHVVGVYGRLAGGERVETGNKGNLDWGVSSFTFDGPDLTGRGAQHCVWASATAKSAGGSVHAEACGVPASGKTKLSLTPAPALSEPRDGTPLTPSTRLSWSRFPGGIHVLRFRPHWWTPDRPEITVFTAGTSAVWPDLRSVGISFPRLETTYDCMVMGRGPFADLDAAVGPAGLASLTSRTQQTGYTQCPLLRIAGAPNPDGGAPAASRPKPARRQGAPAAFQVARRKPAGATDQKAPPPGGIVVGER